MQEIPKTFGIERARRCNCWLEKDRTSVFYKFSVFLLIIGLNLFLKQADLSDFLDHYAKGSRDYGELCTVLQWDKQQRSHNVVNI